MAKRGAAVLEMPEREYAPASRMRLRRDPVEDFADEYDHEPERKPAAAARSAVKLKVGSRLPLPTTVWGMVATGLAMVLLLAGVFWLLAVTRMFLLHDARFRIANASAIETIGNHHLRRGQLLALFSDDLERNIFGVSLDQRQAELEALPWVERATVMRLLPGRLRVAVVERTPVAFVRQGGSVGLVDQDGVLLDMPTGANAEHYAFPVVTGIAAADPASVRAARMRLFARFASELDAGGAKNMESLSEVDLSNPEDVRALVEEKGTTVLAHFGEENFRERFDRMKALLPQWRAQYPNLASADMRYEHEIPLGMAKAASAAAPAPKLAATPVPVKVAPKPVVHPVASAVKLAMHAKTPVVAARSFVPPVVKPWQPEATTPADSRPSVSAAARSAFATKPSVMAAPKAVTVVPANIPVKLRPKAAPGAPVSAPVRPVATAAPKVAATGPKKVSGGKPSAAKPLVSTETNSSPQAAQR